MKRSGQKDAKPKGVEPAVDPVMKYHRVFWRIERVAWATMALLLIAALLGVFGGGPLSHGRTGSANTLTVEYDRILRASAPTQYRFLVHPSISAKGVLRLRVDHSLVDPMQLDSIIPEPDSQSAGPSYTEFSFGVEPGTAPVSIVFQFRPATFGRHAGQVSVPGVPPLTIEHFIYP